MANGLTGVDLARCWISWSILPLSQRSDLMCEYTGSVNDPLRHVNIQLTNDEVTEAVKKMLNEPEHLCARTGLLPFCATNKPPSGDDSFWSKKLPQEKPEKPNKPERPIRPKTKVVKRPAHKRKTTASSDPAVDDDDDAEASNADVVQTQQHEARRTTRHSGQVVTSAGLPNSPVRKRRLEVTSHSSSGESSATQLPPLKTVLGAKPRPSKKARLDKAAEEETAPEPDSAPNLEAAIREDIPNDPPLQDDDFVAEERPVDTSRPADQPGSPIRIEKSTSPSKPADKPTAPVQTGASKDDDVVITGIGHSEPSNPVALAKHSAKEEFATMSKSKWNVDLATYSALNAQELHSGYLNRLYTSRDYEAGLVNMMKEKLEAELKTKESQLTDLQENLKSQQAETSKAKE
ncbi:unnamed protein product [Triticum aestivum]|uniref:Uncharacterized protein n=1 Tax=Triticum aestivum TaxID=4565 RepID=A0A7H4LP20_WHEAT|nr:unnamed protein product [Triticum aestivum]